MLLPWIALSAFEAGAALALVEGLPLVLYVEDDNGLTYISPQIESLLGHPVEDWLEGTGLWRRSLHPDDRERVLAAYERGVAEKAELAYTSRLVRPDSRAVW